MSLITSTEYGANADDIDRLRRRLVHLLPDRPTGSPEGAEPELAALLAEARAAFLDGYRIGLSTPREGLPRLLEGEPPERRGFALEGAGMAAALLDAFGDGSRGNLSALLAGRSTAEQTLVATGVGWAAARLLRPLDRLPTGLHHHHEHAAADGYGFHQGFFHRDQFRVRGFPAAKSDLDASYDIGLGRALWFVNAGRTDLIARDISRTPPERRASMWRGVGTACAFTRCAKRAAPNILAAAGPHEAKVESGLTTGTRLLRALGQDLRGNL